MPPSSEPPPPAAQPHATHASVPPAVARSRWTDPFGRLSLRSGQALMVAAAATLVVLVGITLRVVVVPVLIALLLAAATWPVIAWLGRHGVPRAIAVLLTLLTGLAALGGVFTLVGTAVAEQWAELRATALEGFGQLENALADLPFGLQPGDLDTLLARAGRAVQGTQLQSGVLTGATAAVELLTGVVLMLFVLFFMLKDGDSIWAFAREQLPAGTLRNVDAVASNAIGVLGGYVRGTAVIALVDAVLIGLALVLLGVPLALPLALVTFIASFVPIVGAISAGALAAVVALVLNGPVNALLVVLAIVVVQQVESNLLAPLVHGHNLHLHPVAVLLAIAAGTIAAGIVGAILAVPLAAVAWGAVVVLRRQRAEAAGPGSTVWDGGDTEA